MVAHDVEIRATAESDLPAIGDVLIAAFGNVEGEEINGLVVDLLDDPSAQPLLSLVATAAQQVVGYVLFTGVSISGGAAPVVAASLLAPLAVHPDFQRRGIGGALINAGLSTLSARGVALVFVLGDPGYYTRYGFAPAGRQGLEAPYRIAPAHADAWMVQELQPGALGGIRGRVICADKLNDPKYWQE